MDIVKNILIMTKEHGMSNKDLCAFLKKNPSYISDWKNGKSKPKAEEIVLLAKKFNVTTDYLLGITTPTAPIMTSTERKLLDSFRSLNQNGQNMAVGYLDLLLKDEHYCKLADLPPEQEYEIAAFGGSITENVQAPIKEETT